MALGLTDARARKSATKLARKVSPRDAVHPVASIKAPLTPDVRSALRSRLVFTDSYLGLNDEWMDLWFNRIIYSLASVSTETPIWLANETQWISLMIETAYRWAEVEDQWLNDQQRMIEAIQNIIKSRSIALFEAQFPNR